MFCFCLVVKNLCAGVGVTTPNTRARPEATAGSAGPVQAAAERERSAAEPRTAEARAGGGYLGRTDDVRCRKAGMEAGGV